MSGFYHGNTPSARGYRMPAEWEPQEAVWLAWPHNPEWWGEDTSEIESIYVQFIRALQDGQQLRLVVPEGSVAQRARQALSDGGVLEDRVEFYHLEAKEIYIRDYGPTFVVSQAGELAMVKWHFNAWGGKYESSLQDATVPVHMNQHLKLLAFYAGIVLEGGSIEVNGKGTVLTTEQCLLNSNRNPQLDRSELEGYLKSYLGVSNVLWLGQGLEGDDTDGHIDDVARFVNPTTVVCAYEEDHNDPNHARLNDNYERLRLMRDQDGKPLQVIKLPLARVESSAHSWTGSTTKPASYANFYIGNQTVAVPTFGQENDALALKTLEGCFPGRRVVGINCAQMVLDGGTLHCASQQQPRPFSTTAFFY